MSMLPAPLSARRWNVVGRAWMNHWQATDAAFSSTASEARRADLP